MTTSHAQQPEPDNACTKEESSTEEVAANKGGAGGREPVGTAKGGSSASESLNLQMVIHTNFPEPKEWDQMGLDGQTSTVFGIVADVLSYALSPSAWSTDVLVSGPGEPPGAEAAARGGQEPGGPATRRQRGSGRAVGDGFLAPVSRITENVGSRSLKM